MVVTAFSRLYLVLTRDQDEQVALGAKVTPFLGWFDLKLCKDSGDSVHDTVRPRPSKPPMTMQKPCLTQPPNLTGTASVAVPRHPDLRLHAAHRTGLHAGRGGHAGCERDLGFGGAIPVGDTRDLCRNPGRASDRDTCRALRDRRQSARERGLGTGAHPAPGDRHHCRKSKSAARTEC